MAKLDPDEIDRGIETANGAPTRTLEKGLFLLGPFDVNHPEWTLKELREHAGLPKATTRRLVKTLERRGPRRRCACLRPGWASAGRHHGGAAHREMQPGADARLRESREEDGRRPFGGAGISRGCGDLGEPWVVGRQLDEREVP